MLEKPFENNEEYFSYLFKSWGYQMAHNYRYCTLHLQDLDLSGLITDPDELIERKDEDENDSDIQDPLTVIWRLGYNILRFAEDRKIFSKSSQSDVERRENFFKNAFKAGFQSDTLEGIFFGKKFYEVST